jgi:hypothetical protein
MTTQYYSTSQHYSIETEWQATSRERKHIRRTVDARDNPNAPQFDAAALTAALRLAAKPVSSGVARKVAGTYAIPYDIVIARMRRSRTTTGA